MAPFAGGSKTTTCVDHTGDQDADGKKYEQGANEPIQAQLRAADKKPIRNSHIVYAPPALALTATAMPPPVFVAAEVSPAAPPKMA